MLRHNQGTADEARLRRTYERQLNAHEDTIQDLSVALAKVRQTLVDTLADGNTAEAAPMVYDLASELLRDDYQRACEETEKAREEGPARAAAAERAALDLGHQYVAILTNRAFSQHFT